jgi:potassium efflux system protein
MFSFCRAFIHIFILCFLISPVFSQEIKEKKDTIPSTNSLIDIDNLLLKLESVSSTLDSINKITQNGFDTDEIEEELPEMTENLSVINDNLVHYGKVLNVKNLQMFQVMLEDTRDELQTWRTSLFKYNKELVRMKKSMMHFAKDSTARVLAHDTAFVRLYFSEVKGIKEKWKHAKLFTDANLLRITQLQAKVSKSYFQTIELHEMVGQRLKEFRRRNFGKEYNPIYEIETNPHEDKQTVSLVKKSYKGQRYILGYYFKKHWINQILIVLVGIGFFAWVFVNFRKVKLSGKMQELNSDDFKYLRAIPILATLVVMFNLAPFFDLNPPATYVEIMQFFLLIVLTILFAKNWQRQLFYYWLVIIALYVLITITNGSITPGVKTRTALLSLNIASLLFGILFTWRIRKALALPATVKIVLVIYVVLNGAATILNIFGRVSLAKVLTIAAIFGLTQIIGLSIFIQIITEAFFLQMKSSRIINGNASRLDYDKILRAVKRFLSYIMIVLWVIIFASNLGVYSNMYTAIEYFLLKERSFGSLVYSLWDVLLFFIILYLSNIAQKYVGYFFGASDDEFIPDKRGSRLVVLRLFLLIIGFLLAITASGLPLDKITIVLGALGVGIGLGLQNIVNNLVSGIILIFEKPFEIGDSIEVGTKKGRVKDMGIRSSRLVTSEGSEIIVPNGDLLSGQVTNWSLNDNMIRSEITFKVAPDVIASVKELVVKILNDNAGVIRKNTVQVLVSSLTNEGAEFKVRFWINNVRKESDIKSEIYTEMYKKFKEGNIAII